jgi:hypothetical protein
LAEHLHATAQILLLEGRIGFAAERRRILCDGAGVGFDLRLELDRSIGEFGPFKGFVGGECGARKRTCESNQRGKKAGAKARDHGNGSGWSAHEHHQVPDEPCRVHVKAAGNRHPIADDFSKI